MTRCCLRETEVVRYIQSTHFRIPEPFDLAQDKLDQRSRRGALPSVAEGLAVKLLDFARNSPSSSLGDTVP